MIRLASLEGEIQKSLDSFLQGSSGQWIVEAYDEVTSTMEVAQERCSEVQPDKAGMFIAQKQKSGKGRLGRKWESPPGALLVTFVFPCTAPVSALAGCSLVIGCAVNKALSDLGCRSRLKWPNDILALSGKKIAGILVEVINQGGRAVLLCGIGLNLTHKPSSIVTATSLAELGIEEIVLPKIAARIATHARDYVTRFLKGGFSGFKAEWMRNAANVGQNVIITSGEKKQQGMFLDVTSEGAMRIESNGKIETILSGDVESI